MFFEMIYKNQMKMNLSLRTLLFYCTVFGVQIKKGGKVEKFYKRVPKKQRFLILSEHFNGGLSVSELSRKHQIQPATIYKWREKMKKEEDKPSFDSKQLMEEIKHLKQENSLLKETVAQQALDITTLKQFNEFVKKKQKEERLNMQKSSLKGKGSK